MCSQIKILDCGLAQLLKNIQQQVHRACSVDAELDLAVQEVRVSLCRWLCKRLGVLCLLVACMMYAGGQNSLNLKFFYLSCMVAFVFNLIGAGAIPLTCRSTSFFGVAVYAVFLCTNLSYTSTELTFAAQCGSARVMMRALTGIMVADVGKAIGCNVLVSLGYLARHWRMGEAMAATGYGFNTICINEVVAFSGLILVFLSLNRLVTQCAEIQREELSHAHRWQESMSKLLAVLCDAVCSVTSDLQVIGPCQMLWDLQDVSHRSTNCVCLSSLLKESDLPRVVNFLRTQDAGLSDLHPDVPAFVPAASLHVTFCSQNSGKEIPVQLLAVTVPCNCSAKRCQCNCREHVTHLIGLKHEGVDTLVREEESIADGSLQLPRAQGPSSQSNSSCSSSQASIDALATAGLGIESVTFDVDASSEDLAIHSLVINFDTTVSKGTAGPRPAMSHYVKGDVAWASLKVWLRDATNHLFVGKDPAPGPDLHLRMPSFAGSCSTSLRAMVLQMEEVLVAELDDLADACETLPVRIRLSGIQVLTRHARRFSSRRFAEQKRQQQMPNIAECNGEDGE